MASLQQLRAGAPAASVAQTPPRTGLCRQLRDSASEETPAPKLRPERRFRRASRLPSPPKVKRSSSQSVAGESRTAPLSARGVNKKVACPVVTPNVGAALQHTSHNAASCAQRAFSSPALWVAVSAQVPAVSPRMAPPSNTLVRDWSVGNLASPPQQRMSFPGASSAATARGSRALWAQPLGFRTVTPPRMQLLSSDRIRTAGTGQHAPAVPPVSQSQSPQHASASNLRVLAPSSPKLTPRSVSTPRLPPPTLTTAPGNEAPSFGFDNGRGGVVRSMSSPSPQSLPPPVLKVVMPPPQQHLHQSQLGPQQVPSRRPHSDQHLSWRRSASEESTGHMSAPVRQLSWGGPGVMLPAVPSGLVNPSEVSGASANCSANSGSGAFPSTMLAQRSVSAPSLSISSSSIPAQGKHCARPSCSTTSSSLVHVASATTVSVQRNHTSGGTQSELSVQGLQLSARSDADGSVRTLTPDWSQLQRYSQCANSRESMEIYEIPESRDGGHSVTVGPFKGNSPMPTTTSLSQLATAADASPTPASPRRRKMMLTPAHLLMRSSDSEIAEAASLLVPLRSPTSRANTPLGGLSSNVGMATSPLTPRSDENDCEDARAAELRLCEPLSAWRGGVPLRWYFRVWGSLALAVQRCTTELGRRREERERGLTVRARSASVQRALLTSVSSCSESSQAAIAQELRIETADLLAALDSSPAAGAQELRMETAELLAALDCINDSDAVNVTPPKKHQAMERAVRRPVKCGSEVCISTQSDPYGRQVGTSPDRAASPRSAMPPPAAGTNPSEAGRSRSPEGCSGSQLPRFGREARETSDDSSSSAVATGAQASSSSVGQCCAAMRYLSGSEQTPPLARKRSGLLRSDLRSPAYWRDLADSRRHEESSLQLSPLTPSECFGAGGAPSPLSSTLPSPLRPAAAFSPEQPEAPRKKRTAHSPHGTGADIGPAPLISTLRKRAAVFSERLLRRERQCSALKEALAGYGDSDSADQVCKGSENAPQARDTLKRIPLKQAQQQLHRRPLAPCENVL
eukprot:gnl/TRDRNA2_/TRDRNA2_171818_c0_seq1.p1 gnl/TRDRNA2_/TRDRNA2_171818_c0~~gnl/TRDRNA2_/TRDRNA2_171818_c0_seq1.p1  ORF type:complete len:1029 (-),score=149.54 gnl/TRDRNA2_/TRDRNA2_171818_c0_seq1:124-3210(-)